MDSKEFKKEGDVFLLFKFTKFTPMYSGQNPRQKSMLANTACTFCNIYRLIIIVLKWSIIQLF